jgi:hypothetical protein
MAWHTELRLGNQSDMRIHTPGYYLSEQLLNDHLQNTAEQ